MWEWGILLNMGTKKVEIKIVDKHAKAKKVARIIGDVVFWMLAGFVGIYFLFNGIDQHTNYSLPFFGMRQSVIVSESMAYANDANTYLTDDMHRIDKYDVIITKNYKSYEEIQMYDVLTYTTGSTLICHRVVDLYESNGEQYIVTRGDSNNMDDEPINFSVVRGKVVKVLPFAGRVVLFFQSPYFTIAFCSSLFFIFLGTFIYDAEKAKRERDKPTSVVLEEKEE